MAAQDVVETALQALVDRDYERHLAQVADTVRQVQIHAHQPVLVAEGKAAYRQRLTWFQLPPFARFRGYRLEQVIGPDDQGTTWVQATLFGQLDTAPSQAGPVVSLWACFAVRTSQIQAVALQ